MAKNVSLIACEPTYREELTAVLSKWKNDTQGNAEEQKIKLKNVVVTGLLIATGNNVQFTVSNILPK